MPNRTEARPAKAALTNATGRLPILRLFSTPLIDRVCRAVCGRLRFARRLPGRSIPELSRTGWLRRIRRGSRVYSSSDADSSRFGRDFPEPFVEPLQRADEVVAGVGGFEEYVPFIGIDDEQDRNLQGLKRVPPLHGL